MSEACEDVYALEPLGSYWLASLDPNLELCEFENLWIVRHKEFSCHVDWEKVEGESEPTPEILAVVAQSLGDYVEERKKLN